MKPLAAVFINLGIERVRSAGFRSQGHHIKTQEQSQIFMTTYFLAIENMQPCVILMTANHV